MKKYSIANCPVDHQVTPSRLLLLSDQEGGQRPNPVQILKEVYILEWIDFVDNNDVRAVGVVSEPV